MYKIPERKVYGFIIKGTSPASEYDTYRSEYVYSSRYNRRVYATEKGAKIAMRRMINKFLSDGDVIHDYYIN